MKKLKQKTSDGYFSVIHQYRSSLKMFFVPFFLIVGNTDYGHPMKAEIKDIRKIGLMWQTKYAPAVCT